MNSNRTASQLMSLTEVASHTGKSIESILSLAAEGSLNLAAMYTQNELSKLSPELRESDVLFWVLDRFQVLEIINEGHVILIPPGTLTGWIDEVGRPAERIDTPEEQAPRYKGKAKLVGPADVQVKIWANRLRVPYSECVLGISRSLIPASRSPQF